MSNVNCITNICRSSSVRTPNEIRSIQKYPTFFFLVSNYVPRGGCSHAITVRNVTLLKINRYGSKEATAHTHKQHARISDEIREKLAHIRQNIIVCLVAHSTTHVMIMAYSVIHQVLSETLNAYTALPQLDDPSLFVYLPCSRSLSISCTVMVLSNFLLPSTQPPHQHSLDAIQNVHNAKQSMGPPMFMYIFYLASPWSG